MWKRVWILLNRVGKHEVGIKWNGALLISKTKTEIEKKTLT